MTLRPILLLMILAVLPLSAAASADAALQRFVDGVRTLDARFEQTQTDEKGAVLGRRSGSFQLSRPGQFRWSYDPPYEQLMVCDGQRIWNYEPDLQQATSRPAADVLRGTPAALLAQRSLLGDSFRIVSGGRDGRSEIVRLTPRSGDSDFQAIELWLDDGVPQRMRLQDALGGTTDIRFSQVRTGVKLEAARFRFSPPPGVEVIADGGS